MERYPVTGYTPTYRVNPANKEQLLALRDVLLEWKDENAAMAVDNVIDILSRAAEPIRQTDDDVDVQANFTGASVRYQKVDFTDPRTPIEQVVDFMIEQDGTQLSPIISGGEVYYRDGYSTDNDIPF